MKIVQTLWACNKPDLLSHSAGWLSSEYHLMSWALSCLQLTQNYNDVTLYTDTVSAKTIIDELQLPYTEVHCKYDGLLKDRDELFAVSKLVTYASQNGPFLHVDGDVHIWGNLDEALLQGRLIAQNLESLFHDTMR